MTVGVYIFPNSKIIYGSIYNKCRPIISQTFVNLLDLKNKIKHLPLFGEDYVENHLKIGRKRQGKLQFCRSVYFGVEQIVIRVTKLG